MFSRKKSGTIPYSMNSLFRGLFNYRVIRSLFLRSLFNFFLFFLIFPCVFLFFLIFYGQEPLENFSLFFEFIENRYFANLRSRHIFDHMVSNLNQEVDLGKISSKRIHLLNLVDVTQRYDLLNFAIFALSG